MGVVYSVAAVTDATLRALNYSPQLERLKRVPKSHRARTWVFRPLRHLAAEIGTAYARVLQRVDCEPPLGDELLSQVDIFSTEPAGRRIRGDRMRFVEELRIHRGDVLIAGAGQMGESTLFGRALIADDRLAGKLAAGDLMVVRFPSPDSDEALFSYAFLMCNAGLSGIRACAYGTSIPRMRPDLLADIPIPMPETELQARVAALVRESMHQRELYLREIRAARAAVENLSEMKEAHAMCEDRRTRAILWDGALPTMRAWTFASSGGALRLLQGCWSDRLGAVLNEGGLFHGNLRQRTPCEAPYGLDFYSQRDVFSVRRVPARIAHPGCEDRSLFVPRRSLLIASRGQLSEGALFGRVELGDTFSPRSAATQDILRVLPGDDWLAVAYAFLSTHVGQVLLRSCAVGTSIPILRLDLVRALPLPALDTALCKVVNAAVNRAIAARVRADSSEAEAINIIEEEVLPAWLD